MNTYRKLVWGTSGFVLISVWFLCGFFFLSFQQIFLTLNICFLSEDKCAVQHSIWSRHRGLSVDRWLPLTEGPEQSLGVQQRAGPRGRHGSAACHAGGEKGEVSRHWPQVLPPELRLSGQERLSHWRTVARSWGPGRPCSFGAVIKMGVPALGPWMGTVHVLLGTWPPSRRWVGFTCIYSRSPLLAPLPELRLLPGEGAGAQVRCAWIIPKPPLHPAPVRGKMVFHETGPWCQMVGHRCFRKCIKPLEQMQKGLSHIRSRVV